MRITTVSSGRMTTQALTSGAPVGGLRAGEAERDPEAERQPAADRGGAGEKRAAVELR